MSEAALSALELAFLAETLELVREEFDGVMLDTTNDYVLTTGADYMVEQSMEIIMATLLHLHKDELGDDDEEDKD